MTYRPFSSSLASALVFALVATPSFAQTNAPAPAPADAPATNAAPAAAAPAAAAPMTAPAPVDTTTAPATSTERPASYTMVAGDTLDSVAKKFDTSIHALAKLNKIPHSKYKKLRTGTVLEIPPAKAESTTK